MKPSQLLRFYKAGSTSGWRLTPEMVKKISHYAQFPATGVSLRQMVQFGDNPSAGNLFRASQFIVEELPIRLAHRVKDLEALPNGLSEMPSIQRVRDWYSQSFEELTAIPIPKLSKEIKDALYHHQGKENIKMVLPLSNNGESNGHGNGNGNGKSKGKSVMALKSEPGQQGQINPSLEDWKAEGFQEDIKTSHGHRRYFASVDPNIVQWPIEIENYNEQVTKALQKIKTRHDGVVSTVAQGVLEWKESRPNIDVDYSLQTFLDRFYMSRIGIRMLIGQHIALNLDRGIRPDYVGIICTDTNIRDIAQSAVDNARFICEDWYGLYEAPQVDIVCNPDISFMYVPGHLSHMIFEVVKNSLRAVVELYGVDSDSYPPVKVIVAQGQQDITIKISDEGGGIPRSEVPYVWTYMYTTAKNTPHLDLDLSKSDFKAPLAGFGYGLPISRLYSRYFGGDLKLISMEGYGTDVYLHLNRLSSSSEPLP
ncbi:protein kinase PKP1 [Sugiyamaella lignohabitans]|uniref:Protein-serine/threonine kinase n=1 Tax=Sugiyamaella lignohabitans TaxID=796027 RepID=A0A167D8E5_9ASCO|nr:protein kinase PKP1 [Sugiyamaella lignohabitans]ANB12606.1 protein kinase PKP1 [Sugiyamaella lignohabitans]